MHSSYSANSSWRRLGTATNPRNISTAAGGRLMTASFGATPFNQSLALQISEGEYTTIIYGMIREERYKEVRSILENQLILFPDSRAAISLLAYVCYLSEDYIASAKWYERLIEICPGEAKYSYYHAQALYKASMYQEAIQAAQTLESNLHLYQQDEDSTLELDLKRLQGMIYFELEEYTKSKAQCDKCLPEDPNNIILQGSILYKQGQFDEAKKLFKEAKVILGDQSTVTYNIALSYYKLKRYSKCHKFIQDIVKKGIRDHPELSVGGQSEGFQVRSVGNSKILRDTALIEAFNLKYAIEYVTGHPEDAKLALQDMPPRNEDQLDAVTLHNQALLQMDENANKGFKKLKHLIQNPPFPEETFANLLILYCKHSYFSLAADVLAENAHLAFRYLTQDLYDFLEALIESQTSPEEAYRKFDILATKHIDGLRQITKKIGDARNFGGNHDVVEKLLKQYDEALSHYIPVLMAMGRIYWDIGNYPEVEEILLQSREFCSDNDIWQLNMAHVCFMQETEVKFRESIQWYNMIVEKQKPMYLDIPAMVLANLCVSYIMTNANDQAEELMKQIEREEEDLARRVPSKVSLHLCIVNLVIGTLYCSKGTIGHSEFGIGRVIKSLEPYDKKIMADTWFYAKRCMLSLIETLSKHMITIKDSTTTDIMKFLDASILYGREIETVADYVSHNASGGDFASMYESGFNPNLEQDKIPREKRTVTYEARLLKRMFLKLREGY